MKGAYLAKGWSMTKRMTRRNLLRLAGASAVGVAGLGGTVTLASARANRAGQDVYVEPEAAGGFVSRPGLKFLPVTVRQYGPVSRTRYIFIDVPYTAPGYGGGAIIDRTGQLVWLGPDTDLRHKLDLNMQTLNGERVLTWWQGISVDGHGEGEGAIADSTYTVKHVIKAGNKLRADLHEFVITPQGTALISAYRTHSGVDLSALGGPSSGYIFSGVFQEIDIATGAVLFEWESYDPASPRVPLTETHLWLSPGLGTKALPFDYFHINSIVTDANGDYIVSSRHTWTVYNISKADGSINWRLGGKSSDFTLEPQAVFHWQHHVRVHGHGTMTVFDNGARPGAHTEQQSRALLLNVDLTARKVSLVRAFVHPGTPKVLATALGSAQLLPDGGMFVDWGGARRFSQFAADGTLVLDGEMKYSSYRAFSMEWTGHPTGAPAVAARRSATGATVYVSWNGATEVASWTVFAGRSKTGLSRVGSVPKTGFETAIAVRDPGPYFAVHALDSAKAVLGTSPTVVIT